MIAPVSRPTNGSNPVLAPGMPAAAPAPTPRFTPPGGGESFLVMGIRITPQVTGEDTAGAYTLLEQVVPPGGGPPPHILHRAEKTIYVIDGEFSVRLGERSLTGGSGSCFVIPRGVVHSFTNVREAAPGRILVLVSPAGHERFLAAMSRLGAGGAPDPDEMAALMAAEGVEIVAA